MGSGMKVVRSIVREIDRSQKAAARERARREREHIRRQKQLERERKQEEREAVKLQKQLEKESLKAAKEKLKSDLEHEKNVFENRVNERRKARLVFLNRM
jgi:hypothetical protein